MTANNPGHEAEFANQVATLGPGLTIGDPEVPIAPKQQTLTYAARRDPQPGSLMGPGNDGRIWRVVGSVWDEAQGKTYVTVEEAW